MLSVGSVIGGRFQVQQVLGSGGMGYVVAARHTTLGNLVAIKLLRDEVAASPAINERFIREARAVVGLRTEHVCRVSDVDRLDTGAPYIVMELLDGVDLQRTVARSPLPITTAVEYVLQACVALAEAHAAGIIHRDLKPANLFVVRRPDGGPLVKVLDFGIAKALTEPGVAMTQASAMGSPGYMSPEQVQNARDVDARTDIWALGVTLFQLLSARLPFPGPTITEIAVGVMHDAPERLDTDPVLHGVVMKCLEKSPDRRYQTIAELMVALAPFGGPTARRYLAEAGVAISVPPPMTAVPISAVRPPAVIATQPQAPAPAPVTKRRWPIAVIALLLIGGAIAALVIVQQHQQAQVRQDASPVTPVVAAVVTPPDAAPIVSIDAAPARPAGDPWQQDSSPAVDKEPDPPPKVERPKRPKHAEPDIYAQVAESKRQMAAACKEMFANEKKAEETAAMNPPAAIMCACAIGDRERAQKLIDKMPESMHAQMKQLCASTGGLKL
ncbi:MAG: protein kinase [Kofleriaceae bacterium]